MSRGQKRKIHAESAWREDQRSSAPGGSKFARMKTVQRCARRSRRAQAHAASGAFRRCSLRMGTSGSPRPPGRSPPGSRPCAPDPRRSGCRRCTGPACARAPEERAHLKAAVVVVEGDAHDALRVFAEAVADHEGDAHVAAQIHAILPVYFAGEGGNPALRALPRKGRVLPPCDSPPGETRTALSPARPERRAGRSGAPRRQRGPVRSRRAAYRDRAPHGPR